MCCVLCNKVIECTSLFDKSEFTVAIVYVLNTVSNLLFRPIR